MKNFRVVIILLGFWGRCRWSTNPDEALLFIKYDSSKYRILDVEKKAFVFKVPIQLESNCKCSQFLFYSFSFNDLTWINIKFPWHPRENRLFLFNGEKTNLLIFFPPPSLSLIHICFLNFAAYRQHHNLDWCLPKQWKLTGFMWLW